MRAIRPLIAAIVALLSLAIIVIYTARAPRPSGQTTPSAQTSAAAEYATSSPATSSTAAKTSVPIATSSDAMVRSAPIANAKKSSFKGIKSTPPAASSTAQRIEDPYTTPPSSFSVVNDAARAGVVNILCVPRSGGLSPISGSGVLIDPRGIILTNAHVAQYVLLSEDPKIDLRCFVRTGSPAEIRWTPTVLFMPPAWVAAHASEISDPHPRGTGEHDYALLMVSGSADGTALPARFPYLTPDTREGIAFYGDSVLVASYPAEFAGGSVENNLYAASSVSTVRQLLTFATSSIDAISVGGVIEAQGGSSGGAVVNGWQRLVGLITTTSAGASTIDRDLRAVTLAYIDRDFKAQSGLTLETLAGADIQALATQFTQEKAPDLIAALKANLR